MKFNHLKMKHIAMLSTLIPLVGSLMPLQTHASKWQHSNPSTITKNGRTFKLQSYADKYLIYTDSNNMDYIVENNELVGPNPNFKTFSTPANDTSHNTINPGNYYNTKSISTIFTGGIDVRNKTGEWRYIGYNKLGEPVHNPLFPSDGVNSNTIATYPWDSEPWNQYAGGQRYVKGSRYDDPKLTNYDEKLYAIENVLLKDSDTRIMRNTSTSPAYWANKLSMKTSPFDTMGVFEGTREGGCWYRVITTGRAPAPQNLRITNMKVYKIDENGQLGESIGVFSRSSKANSSSACASASGTALKKVVKGNKYKVITEVKDMNPGGKGTSMDPSKILVDGASGQKAQGNYFVGNPTGNTVTSPGRIDAGGFKYFTADVIIPMGKNPEKKYAQRAFIPEDYNNPVKHIFENSSTEDDWANIVFDVSEGDLIAKDATVDYNGKKGYTGKIEAIDMAGNVANLIIPGQPYKFRYNVLYKGDNLDYNVNIPADINIVQHTQKGDVKKHIKVEKKSVRLKNNQEITFETGYEMFDTPNISTDITIDKRTNDLGINDKLTNDKNGTDIKAPFDYTIKNLKVIPGTLRVEKPGQYRVNIKYDIDVNIPERVNIFEQDLLIRTRVDGKNYSEETRRVYVGKDPKERQRNKNISQEIILKDIDPNNLHDVPIDVLINANKAVYEDNYNNNLAGTLLKMKRGYEPTQCASGVITSIDWLQEYLIHGWEGHRESYTDSDGHRHSYTVWDTWDRTENVNHNETFKIDKIEFKSKLTEDTKEGQNGWVDITNGKPGRIKAGYGFELKIKTSYNTNVLATQPKPWGGYWKGENVTPQHVYPNIPTEIYVDAPGSEKTLSVTGNNQTYAGLINTEAKREGDKSTWTYEIKPTDTLGVKNAPKIYVGEDTKDGVYPFKIYTPEIFGIGTEYTDNYLCDLKNPKIEVVGGSTDDLNTHIIQ